MTHRQLLAAAAAVKKLIPVRSGQFGPGLFELTEVLLSVRRHPEAGYDAVVNALIKVGATKLVHLHRPDEAIVSAALELDGVVFRAQYCAPAAEEQR